MPHSSSEPDLASPSLPFLALNPLFSPFSPTPRIVGGGFWGRVNHFSMDLGSLPSLVFWLCVCVYIRILVFLMLQWFISVYSLVLDLSLPFFFHFLVAVDSPFWIDYVSYLMVIIKRITNLDCPPISEVTWKQLPITLRSTDTLPPPLILFFI